MNAAKFFLFISLTNSQLKDAQKIMQWLPYCMKKETKQTRCVLAEISKHLWICVRLTRSEMATSVAPYLIVEDEAVRDRSNSMDCSCLTIYWLFNLCKVFAKNILRVLRRVLDLYYVRAIVKTLRLSLAGIWKIHVIYLVKWVAI